MEKEILAQKAKMLEEVMNDKSYVPMKAKELAMLLGIPKSQRDELTQVLDYLVSEGRIGISKKGKYGKPEVFSVNGIFCLLYTSPSPRDMRRSRMPSSA